MKTFFFHLMPYADLDLSYTDRYDSAWVTLPNSYFDPKVGEKLYAATSANSNSPMNSVSTASASTSTTRPPMASCRRRT